MMEMEVEVEMEMELLYVINHLPRQASDRRAQWKRRREAAGGMKEERAVAVEEAKRAVGMLLLTEIPKTLHLRSKWSLVTAQLDLLKSNLDRLDPLSTDLDLDLLGLDSIADTLTLILTLSRSCQSPSLHHGKLLSNSRLNSALSSLRLHVSDSRLLLDSGLFRPPSPSESPKAKRNAVLTLIARLQIGCHDSRSSAMDSLLRILDEGDKNVVLAISQGIIPVLVTLLDSAPADYFKDKIVYAISRISRVESGKRALDTEGLLLLNHLLRVVVAGNGFAQLKACIALQALTLSKENARTISARGGIASLMEICVTGMSSTQASATGVLRNLTGFPELKDKFMEEGAVSVLFAVLSCGTAAAREDALRCLCNLVRDDDVLKVEVVQGRVIPRLKNYWDSVPSEANLQAAAEFLSELASFHPIGEAILADGFLDKLLSILHCEISGVRTASALAIHKLSPCLKSSNKEIEDGGCIPALVGMLDSKSVSEREASAMALSGLLVNVCNRRIFYKCGIDGVTSTVRLLDPSCEDKLDPRYPVSILSSLVTDKKCRKLMVTAGACGHLEKLSRMNVEGARKLYESISSSSSSSISSRGRIWDILPHHS